MLRHRFRIQFRSREAGEILPNLTFSVFVERIAQGAYNPKAVQTEPMQIKNFIGGEFVEPIGGKYLDNIEPATGKPYSQVADSDAHDIDLAVAAAEKAFHDWSSKPAAERSRYLLRIADLIERDLEKFARAESIDTGKPISLARSLDIPRAVANFRFFATAILHTESEAHITDNVAFNYTLRQPRGIAGLISPWNLPLYLLSWKIAPAIAVGNTAIAKPSELTPTTAYMLCEVVREAGLPNGVLNVVHGTGPNVGAAITAHPKIDTISFTGGTVTGRKVAEACAPLFKKMSLELGGKNPNIIFADADLDAAIDGSVRSSFANQGQVCLCGSRIFVERSAYKDFVDRFIDKASQLKIGDPLDEKTEQGAIVNKTQSRKSGSTSISPRKKAARSCSAVPRRNRLTSAAAKDIFFNLRLSPVCPCRAAQIAKKFLGQLSRSRPSTAKKK